MENSFTETGRKTLIIILLLFTGTISVYTQTLTSYSANTIPIGGNGSAAFGISALSVNTGSSNTGIGYQALMSNTTANFNTAIGSQSLRSNTTGSANIAIGTASLFNNTTGGNNTAIGHNALVTNTTGSSNTATGFQSLNFNTTGTENTANGSGALTNNSIGFQNTAIGRSSLNLNTVGSNNTASGYFSLNKNTTGNNNSAFGHGSLFSNTTGEGNSAFGKRSLLLNTSGNYNTVIGDSAGYNNNGNNNVFIGFAAGVNEFSTSNKLYLSNNASNTILYGDFSTGQILLGKPIPTGYTFKGTRTLNVLGGIISDSIRLSPVTAWADHVFADDYKLMPLEELSNFIKTNKHLPNIPTSAAVEKNGIELGAMNAKLLEKIEELHLYILQQQNQMDGQNKINEIFQKQINDLKQNSSRSK